MAKLKADLVKESTFNEGGKGKRSFDPVQYSPLPTEGGTSAGNKVVVSLVAPALWSMFNPTAQDIEKYGLSSQNVFGGDREWGSLYFQIPSHRVMNFSYANGNVGFAYSVCPLALNKYLVEALGLAPLFDTPVRCAYCEEKERLWEAHNAAWASLDIDKGNLSKDGYFAAMKEHSILQQTRDAAYGVAASEKYVVSVFDHDKFTGKRNKDEGQEQVTWQSWYAPNAIYEGIKDLHKGLSDAGMPPFFDVENPAGVHILTMTKDTTGWTKSSKLKTKYAVQNVGEHYAYPPEWIAYLNADENLADPSSFIHMLSYEEQQFYIQTASEKQSFNRKTATTVDTGGVQPTPPAQMAPPTQAVPAAAVPQPTAVPTPAVPVPAQTVPPQAVAPTPVAQVAPVPQPVAAGGPPIPVLPAAVAPVPAATPATPAPVVGGAPIPDREPPIGGPPPATGRVAWDE